MLACVPACTHVCVCVFQDGEKPRRLSLFNCQRSLPEIVFLDSGGFQTSESEAKHVTLLLLYLYFILCV